MRALYVALLLLAACRDPAIEVCTGDRLFGRPTADTGLTEAQCGPSTCDCNGWTPPTLGDTQFAAWRALTLEPAFDELTSDPYEETPTPVPADAVCGIRVSGSTYALTTYATADEAVAAEATITHRGICGVCSTLDDLAVYAGTNDLTKPVRQCGLDHLFGSAEEHLACLEALGFTRPCAWIWYYNTKHTRTACADECFAAIDDPYHLEDGALNPCLRCDERESGPVFKAVAGRTRRNSGLATALCRPCDSVTPLDHAY